MELIGVIDRVSGKCMEIDSGAYSWRIEGTILMNNAGEMPV